MNTDSPKNLRIAESGWGYWDVTNYPRGGDFRRLTEDTPVELIADPVRIQGNMEVRVRFANGRNAMIQVKALKDEGGAQ